MISTKSSTLSPIYSARFQSRSLFFLGIKTSTLLEYLNPRRLELKTSVSVLPLMPLKQVQVS